MTTYGFDSKGVERIRKSVRNTEGAILGGKSGRSNANQAQVRDGLRFINKSGEKIPANSVAKVDKINDDDDTLFELVKPDADNLTNVMIVPRETANDANGICYTPTDINRRVRVETKGDPEPDTNIGTTDDEWTMTAGNDGFKVVGIDGDGLASMRPIGGGGTLLVKAVADPSGGEVSVKYVDYEGNVVGDAFTVKTLPDT